MSIHVLNVSVNFNLDFSLHHFVLAKLATSGKILFTFTGCQSMHLVM